MRQRGITLVELLLAMFIAAIVMMAASTSYIVGARSAKTLGNARDSIARRAAFETRLTDLFRHAYLDPDTANTGSYFLSGDAITSGSLSTTSTGTTGGLGGSLGGGSSSSNGSLAFTVVGRRLPNTVLSTTDDFETSNQNRGPVGGMTEVELGTTPVGSPANGQTGLFLREQTPADADPSQGGEESVLSADVESISFEFYDGTQWQTSWDTSTMTPRRLPSAVRVTYRYTGDTQDRVLVFALPASDVTPDNPVTTSTTTTVSN